MSQADVTASPVNESFAELLDQSFQEMTSIEGSVVAGTVLSVEKDMILIDVGLKSEGRVPLREFGNNEEDIYLIKTDVNGIEQWSATYGGTGFDKGRSVQQTTDGGYIVVGNSEGYELIES